MPANKICPCTNCTAHPGSCPNPVTKGRCPRCQQAARQARAPQQQAYDWQHQQRRTALFAKAIATPCPDCGKIMTAGNMVADHSEPLSVNPNSIADRVHCRTCSNRQGGKLSQAST